MKILIVCFEMETFTGSPLYNYTLAIEFLKQGHKVSIFTTHWADNELKANLLKAGCNITEVFDEEYDITLISQPLHNSWFSRIKSKKILNVIHSEYHWETPMNSDRINAYIAIRENVKQHIVKEHKIPQDMVFVVYNGVDLARFSAKNRIVRKDGYIKVVLPCTLDPLREKFLNYYAKRASQHFRVFIYGKNHMNKGFINPWVSVNDVVPNIEEKIKDADIVAGILLGRVNLEARAMGVVSVIHNPDNPEEKEYFFPEWEEFDERHNIKNVAKQIIDIATSAEYRKRERAKMTDSTLEKVVYSSVMNRFSPVKSGAAIKSETIIKKRDVSESDLFKVLRTEVK